MSILRRARVLAVLALSACGGQTISNGPADSGTGDDVIVAAADGPSGSAEGGTSVVGSSSLEGGPVEPSPVDAAVASGDEPPDTDCASACQTKAVACGTSDTAAVPLCEAVCTGTDSQRECLFSSDCTTLEDAFSENGTVCGLGCMPLCQAKAMGCGAPLSQAITACQELCAGSPTPDELACILEGTCASLEATFADSGSVCGVGG
jgi:hypothetical protein